MVFLLILFVALLIAAIMVFMHPKVIASHRNHQSCVQQN